MPIDNICRAGAATPIAPNRSDPGREAGEAAAPTGTLHLPAQPSSLSLVVAGADAAPDPRWSLLAGPMQQIAGYLSLRDRIALSPGR